MIVRPAREADLPFLREMLMEAAYWRPEASRPSLDDALARPDLAPLLADWGREGDTGVVATASSGEPLGAAWYRFWTQARHSYGFVAESVPELAIGVRAERRGRGIGTALLRALLDAARSAGVARVSLSVEAENPALRLYARTGFRAVGRAGGALTMTIEIGGPR